MAAQDFESIGAKGMLLLMALYDLQDEALSLDHGCDPLRISFCTSLGVLVLENGKHPFVSYDRDFCSMPRLQVIFALLVLPITEYRHGLG